MIVFKLPACADREELQELIELHFNNHKRTGVSKYESIQLRDRFVYLIFANQQDCLTVLSRKHVVGGYELEVGFFLCKSKQSNHFDNCKYISNMSIFLSFEARLFAQFRSFELAISD